MLEIKYVRENIDMVKKALESRGGKADFDTFIELEKKRRELLQEIEGLRHKRNTVSDEIAQMKKSGENAESRIIEMRQVSENIKSIDRVLSETEESINIFMTTLPNIPHTDVPYGLSEDDNRLEKQVGTPATFDFEVKAHWDIGEELGILDFARATKITGARFPLYMGSGARLERALINFMLDIHINEHGFTEVLPPFMVNRKSLTGTGQLPKFEEDLFKVEGWDYFMIPTSEVPMTNIYAEEIIPESMLPIRFTAYTPCFRSEAGSHGRDTRGLIRQHQFNKVEMVKYATPETSFDELESMLASAETILERLGLPYQVITLCTGDMGFSATKTYDIEVWMPAQNKYREISSCSNCGDFQARRAGIKFRREGAKKPEFAHTLNGSGLAVGRCFAAILENYQQSDGSVKIPDALIPYMGGQESINHENR
ncbi:seryl-tRNA synthetase, also charges selenocysteinyl-tRNA with serine [Desulfamplus magnetovallimortis]|uniref:Serine--tRNA ligase n=1 Tax=Desulfamplus magnetovallimortis TaxID=1246637 RepID=A0A1W1HGW2_9BACT|nr:serine--tRNA ligase [Desulfamplus magnetovallimortis]SLM31737.1 seryl-tRNA synthetase, also charges selenocysteinyl-tRNA with serine [Desulfamplus magnetovallimortis]